MVEGEVDFVKFSIYKLLMDSKGSHAGDGKTRRCIVQLLKSEGEMDCAQLAARLEVTPMAVRQHLNALLEQKLIAAEERPAPIGRPAKYWRLTREADRLFPDAYAELSVSLIDAMRDAYGADGLQRVLESRYDRQQASYAKRIGRSLPLKKKVQALACLRTEEGYMAEVSPEENGGYLLIENHCPICAAATVCKGFCEMELQLFRSVLGPNVSIERTEHIVSGNRRCAYRIAPLTNAAGRVASKPRS